MQPISPDWLPSISISAPVDRKRGLLLTAFLSFSMFGHVVLGSVLVLFAGVFAGAGRASDGLDPAADFAARAASHTMLFLALLAITNLGFLGGVWMWKKWGVYGYGLVSGLAMLVGMRLAPASAAVSVLWAGIVAAMIASKWRHFE